DEPLAGSLAVLAGDLALGGGFASRGLAPLLRSPWSRHAARRVGRHRTQATPADRALVLELATLRSDLFAGSSVPTSVSLSSPRMKASTRSRATSSWIWMGGLFMKYADGATSVPARPRSSPSLRQRI